MDFVQAELHVLDGGRSGLDDAMKVQIWAKERSKGCVNAFIDHQSTILGRILISSSNPVQAFERHRLSV